MRKFIMNESNDHILNSVQRTGIWGMIICFMTFFPVWKAAHSKYMLVCRTWVRVNPIFHSWFLPVHILLFLAAAFLAIGIGIIWLLRAYLPFRDAALKQYYLEHPEYAPKEKLSKLKDAETSSALNTKNSEGEGNNG